MTMRQLLLLPLALLTCTAAAQAPEFSLLYKFRPTLTWEKGGASTLRWYDADGQSSVVGFRLYLENGARMLMTQRIQPIPNNSDDESIEELFLDLRDEWRFGRQAIPFGQKGMIHEFSTGISFNTELVFDNAPMEIGVFDGGEGRESGTVLRAGRDFGLSVAVGNHFGAQATSLTQIRRPEKSPGLGRGFGLVLGADGKMKAPFGEISGEWISLREPETEFDKRDELSDLVLKFDLPIIGGSIKAGWTHSWIEGGDWFRIQGTHGVSSKASLQPFVRIYRGKVTQAGVTIEARF